MASVTLPDLTADLRGVASQLPSGVALVCALADGEPHGVTAGSVVPASFDPPLVALFLATGSRTGDALDRAGRFSVSFLDADDHAVARRFSRPDRPAGWEGFAGLDVVRRDPDPPILARAAAWLDCRLERLLPLGDHCCVVGSVVGCGRRKESSPLIYHRGRFRSLGPAVVPVHWPISESADLAADW